MKKSEEYIALIKARIRARDAKSPAVRLADWRADHGFTQDTLAVALGVNVYTVKKWEGGDRKPIKYLGLALAAIAAKLSPTTIDNSKPTTSLAHWRKERKLTQEAFAAMLDVNVFTVKKWEGETRQFINFLGLALSAIDRELVPVKVNFERRMKSKLVQESEISVPTPF